MQTKSISLRVLNAAKAAAAACVLPVFLIYIMVGKPDYAATNAIGHIVLPAAGVLGDAITWPLRAGGRAIANIRELSDARDENERLRAELDAARALEYEYRTAIAENQRLSGILDIQGQIPQKTIVATIVHDGAAFGHQTFFLSKGANDGIGTGQAIVTPRRQLVGIVMDAGADFARARALADPKSNIPVRIAGTGVYGFLRGGELEYLSDQNFQLTPGLRLITSNISGVLPDGILVGDITDDLDVRIVSPGDMTDALALEFDGNEKYN